MRRNEIVHGHPASATFTSSATFKFIIITTFDCRNCEVNFVVGRSQSGILLATQLLLVHCSTRLIEVAVRAQLSGRSKVYIHGKGYVEQHTFLTVVFGSNFIGGNFGLRVRYSIITGRSNG